MGCSHPLSHSATPTFFYNNMSKNKKTRSDLDRVSYFWLFFVIYLSFPQNIPDLSNINPIISRTRYKITIATKCRCKNISMSGYVYHNVNYKYCFFIKKLIHINVTIKTSLSFYIKFFNIIFTKTIFN